MTPPTRRLVTVSALGVGVALWFLVGGTDVGLIVSLVSLGVGIASWLLWSAPAIERLLGRWLAAVRDPSPRARRTTMAIVFVIAVAYLGFTARAQGRHFVPRYHDEHMYVIQMRMLAEGRLWMPQHPVAESFETFHILHDPAYAPISFPGTALAYVPAIWLRLPLWLLPLCVTGLSVAMLYRVIAELVDGAAGLAAVVLALGSSILRQLSIMVMSHTLLLLLGLLMLWAWLRWRKSTSLGWALAIGVLAGWAAITRPVEAICWAAPVGVAMVLDLLSNRARKGLWARTILVILAGAMPFLALQAAFNVGVTGSLTRSAYQMYFARYLPQSTIGFHEFDPARLPDSTLLQRLVYYKTFDVAHIEQHRPEYLLLSWRYDRMPKILRSALHQRLLWILVPVGLLGVTNRRRGTLLAVLMMFLGFYVLFTYLLPHYAIPILPAIVLTVVLTPKVIQQAFPEARLEDRLMVSIVALGLTALPPINWTVTDDPQSLPVMDLNHQLPKLLQQPALVLFKYHRNLNPHEEPVYNVDVAWPDDAPIVRAHDLGQEQNLKLLQYYAERQPERHVYFIDRETLAINYQGRAGELWERFRNRPSTTATTGPSR